MDILGLGDIGRQHQGAILGAGFRGGLLEHFLSPADQPDLVAVLQQRERGRFADAGAGARDEGDSYLRAHGDLRLRKSSRISLKRSGRSMFGRWPAPFMMTSSAPGMRFARSRAICTG